MSRCEAGLWFGLLGGMAAWALHLGVSYAIVPYVCGTGEVYWLHVATAATGVVALAATATAVVAHRRLRRRIRGAGEEGAGAGYRGRAGEVLASARRRNFMAISGMLLSGFFLALIVAEGLPALLMADPCAQVPTLDRPMVQAGGAWAHDRGFPHPGEAWRAWNFEAWLLIVLGAAAGVYARGVGALWRAAGRGAGIRRWRAVCYAGGLLAIVAALVSPIEALSGALFWVHMIQHLLLMVVAAPLLVLGRPVVAWLWALPPRARRRVGGAWRGAPAARRAWRTLTHPGSVFVLHAVALWVWHLPSLYQAALESDLVHHLEHASFFATALLFWWLLADTGARRLAGQGAAVLYVFATLLQSGALGALITFARIPWYPIYAEGVAAWGWDALDDQQLAGVIMWVPAGLVYAAAAVALFAAWLAESERRLAVRESRRQPGRAGAGPSVGRTGS